MNSQITQEQIELESRIAKGEKVVERLTMETRDLCRDLVFKENELVLAKSELANLKAEQVLNEREKLLVAKRPAMTAAEHNAFPSGRY